MKPISLLSPEKLQVIRDYAVKVKGLVGEVIEVGVYNGGSIVEISECFPNQIVYGFDTFEGLPEKFHASDEVHQPGDFNVSYIDLNHFPRDYPNIALIKGIFPEGVGESVYKFAHLDVDFGASLDKCLRYLWPRMVKGAIIIVDDYGWHMTPNIRPTVDHFLAHNSASCTAHLGFQYIIEK